MNFIEILKAVFLGVVQGITEWLPISSTGHLILFNDFINLQVYADTFSNKEFVDMFTVVIQLGSILAVLLLYFNKLNPFSKIKNPLEKRQTIDLWINVIIAAVPGAIIGFLFDDFIDSVLYNSITVALMLIIYGVLFIWIENRKSKPFVTSLSMINWKVAVLIGIFQVLALIPGTSRSGATILGAILIGCSRGVAAEFSFFLAIPMMFGASLLKLLKMKIVLDLAGIVVLITGMVVAFIVSIFAIKFLMSYIKKHDFKVFGYYRIILGVIILIYFLIFR